VPDNPCKPAQAWPAPQLADGPRPAAELIERAASAEIWKRTLYRAASFLR
jgi:hypothetical protein